MAQMSFSRGCYMRRRKKKVTRIQPPRARGTPRDLFLGLQNLARSLLPGKCARAGQQLMEHFGGPSSSAAVDAFRATMMDQTPEVVSLMIASYLTPLLAPPQVVSPELLAIILLAVEKKGFELDTTWMVDLLRGCKDLPAIGYKFLCSDVRAARSVGIWACLEPGTGDGQVVELLSEYLGSLSMMARQQAALSLVRALELKRDGAREAVEAILTDSSLPTDLRLKCALLTLSIYAAEVGLTRIACEAVVRGMESRTVSALALLARWLNGNPDPGPSTIQLLATCIMNRPLSTRAFCVRWLGTSGRSRVSQAILERVS